MWDASTHGVSPTGPLLSLKIDMPSCYGHWTLDPASVASVAALFVPSHPGSLGTGSSPTGSCSFCNDNFLQTFPELLNVVRTPPLLQRWTPSVCTP